MKKIYSVLVENRSGVLCKVAGLFSRRAFNIDSLVVGETDDPSVSCMTIVSSGDNHTLEQIEKQLNKKLDIIKVKTFDEPASISRERMAFPASGMTEKFSVGPTVENPGPTLPMQVITEEIAVCRSSVNGSMTRKKMTPDSRTKRENSLPRSDSNVMSPKPSVDMTVSVQYRPVTGEYCLPSHSIM